MTTKKTNLSRASELIRGSQRPLLVCHVTPDDDAIGSLTGLGGALRRLALEPTMACSDVIASRLRYIPGADQIVQRVESAFDLVVSVDCSDLCRLGSIAQLPGFDSVPLINIDHHVSNPGFGEVNLVDAKAACTAEIVLELLDYMGAAVDTETATSLLAGVVGDTRGFRTNNVTVTLMETAVRLMKAGAPLPHTAFHGLDRRTIGSIKLWGAALELLRIEDGVIWATIPLAVRQAVGFDGPGDAGLAGFLNGADEADVAAVLTERKDGNVEVGLRASPGFDVAQVAAQFGGGGHALAAGCLVDGPLEEAERRVLAALKASVAARHGSAESG